MVVGASVVNVVGVVGGGWLVVVGGGWLLGG